uniref:Uncharacterized protein n=1 Tax=Rhizophora mucronata TaxID=61149 RepID=A0A2P2NQ00_RHIMU
MVSSPLWADGCQGRSETLFLMEISLQKCLSSSAYGMVRIWASFSESSAICCTTV